MLFTAVKPLILLARNRIIEYTDLVALPPQLEPRIDEDFVIPKTWGAFLFALIKRHIGFLKWGYSFYLLALVFQLLSPVLINQFVKSLENLKAQPELWQKTLFFATALGLSGIVTGLCYQFYFYNTLRTYQKVTNLLNALLFKHTLKLSRGAQQKTSVGDVVNHMSSDSEAVSDAPLIIADLVWAAGTIIVVCLMLFYYIGSSAVFPLLLMLGLAPLSRSVAKRYLTAEEKMFEIRDRRVNLMTQVLGAIRLIKFFAWERPISDEVMAVRNSEIDFKKRIANLEVVSGFLFTIISTAVLLATFWVHTLRGFELDAALIFTLVALFGLLEEPFGSLARLIGRFTAARVGIERIRKYLAGESVENSFLESSDGHLNLNSVSFRYPGQTAEALKNLNLKIAEGEAVAVVGAVGSGKSTFLLGLLGEVPLSAGTLSRPGSFAAQAFVPQEAYIINSTLVENIGFGSSFTADELRKALHLACLEKDVRDLPGGLKTEIGEKGVNLSGGQKQRVSLARAVLAKPQFVLLDDPLSAVDPTTEGLLVDRLIFGHWKETTRLVVTHRLEHLQKFDKIIFIEGQTVSAFGSYSEVYQVSQPFRDLMKTHELETRASRFVQTSAHVAETAESVLESRQTEDEDRETGAVKKTIYFDYLRSLSGGKKWIAATLILGALAATALPLLQKYWLAYFAQNKETLSTTFALNIYGLLGLGVLAISMGNHLNWLQRGIQAGVDLHNRMLQGILKAPIRFFDSTPVGRILQRFSRDLESVDFHLQFSFESAFYCFFQILVSLVFIIALLPALILVIIPVGFLYYTVQRDYRRPAREIKRIDSIKRSPRFAHFKETLQGLTVIRAYKREAWFSDQFLKNLRESQKAFYNHFMLNRWFSSRVPVVAGLISIFTCLGLAFSVRSEALSPGVAGLAALYSLSFWGYLNWAVRVFSDIESRLTSVERLKFMAEIPSELDFIGDSDQSALWSPRGEIEFQGVSARYADHLPLVLKDLHFKIPSGAKVGLIGRTGSGKSTVFQALYRLFPLESGRILFDGIDGVTLPLEKLRKQISIVPQDATLFMGSVRSNLDRFGEFTDEEVIAVLRRVYLLDFVQALPEGIHTPVSENGQNFSLGQRQLFCLARALLLDVKIVILDESTASVDVVTDALIQKVLKESLQDVTVLIIAHRLGTISDVDFIIELQDGELKSIQSPGQTKKDLTV